MEFVVGLHAILCIDIHHLNPWLMYFSGPWASRWCLSGFRTHRISRVHPVDQTQEVAPLVLDEIHGQERVAAFPGFGQVQGDFLERILGQFGLCFGGSNHGG